MNTALILGANGRFGQAACHAFAAAGWRVLAQVRRPLAHRAAGQALIVPLDNTPTLARVAAGARVVVHAINPIYTRWEQEAMPALQHGLAAARALGATFMLPGNVYNFGTQLPPLLHEDTPTRPDTPKALMREAMEARMRAAASAGTRGVVIRAGDFFGCGTGSWLDQLVAKDIGRGRITWPGPRELTHAWAYLPDLARAFVAVAERPHDSSFAAPFEVLHFEGHSATGEQFIHALEQAATGLGLRPQQGFVHKTMPWGVVRAVGLVHPMWRELARMSYLWRMPHRLDGSRLAARVGALPATPLVAALRQSLLDLGFGAPERHAIVTA